MLCNPGYLRRDGKMCGSALVIGKQYSLSPQLSKALGDDRRPCMAQSQPSKPQCFWCMETGEADQKTGSMMLAVKLIWKWAEGHIMTYQMLLLLPLATSY